jgi:hypothetical protein
MSSSPFDSLDVSDDVLTDVFSSSSSPHTPTSPAAALLPQLSLDAILFGNSVVAPVAMGVDSHQQHQHQQQHQQAIVFDVAPPPPLDVNTGAPVSAQKRKSPHVDAKMVSMTTTIHHDSPLRTPPIADETSSTAADVVDEANSVPATTVVRKANASVGAKNGAVAVAAPLQGALDASGYRPKPSKRARMQAQVGSGADGEEFLMLDDEPSTEEILSAAIAARDDETATLEAIALFPEVTEDTSAALPRDALLQATSNALDEWQNRITAVRALTPADKRELQRQRRLVKNRESAQLSRLRKKGYIGELEAQLTKLAAENDNLKAQNVALREEVERLKRAGVATPSVAVPPPPVANAAAVYVDVDEPAQAAAPRGSSRRQRGGAAVSLLLMLISFGALWNAGSRTRSPALNSASTALVPVGGRALMSVKDEEAKVVVADGVPVVAEVADVVDPIVVRDAAIEAGADAAQQPFGWLSREAWRINASREAESAAAAAAAASKKVQPQPAENGFGTLLDIVDKSDRFVHEHAQQQIKLAKMKKQQQQGVPPPSKPYSAAAAGMPVQKASSQQQQQHQQHQHQQQQQQQQQQQRKVSIEAATAVAPWGEASGPVANATYWFVPQIRSLKRGDDATLLGIMLPLSALDPDAVPDSDDSPVVEVMCKVQSVQRTPFTQHSFEGDVHIE